MGYYKCFVCIGQPTFKVPDKKDPWEESHKHYLTFHYKEPEDATQKRETNS